MGGRSQSTWARFCHLPSHSSTELQRKQASQNSNQCSHMGCQHHKQLTMPQCQPMDSLTKTFFEIHCLFPTLLAPWIDSLCRRDWMLAMFHVPVPFALPATRASLIGRCRVQTLGFVFSCIFWKRSSLDLARDLEPGNTS